ncbi:phosphatase PAP2 family protein [Clostridium saccharobutylicum]|uniref:phosphatase PAP2 family protein n=1 Tax=Clostridium saccharobutylicum TaxID=169679 RepID=UPI00059F8234|nr:phosphatase PAP2 family protein [Clostridium saccharobutylicum]NOV57442.1 undecaprenyl-diphosphatase [Clostridium saccharobutylicum]NOV85418.1 undecaprenyl-diphosphatase [Clostridium saccharobutylicum]NOW10834.1 undecaprenyl-diphosphatase [Clostridium saccharobutylicum]NOW65804.1 undecaprenyl-diphosphatase [Clostridium saccharobutylicum]
MKEINKFDNYILCFIKKYVHNKYLDILMPIITYMGNVGSIWIIIASIILLGNTHKLIGYITIFTLIIGTILGEGIVKNIVRRVRPCNKHNNVSLLISRPLSYSFPSGHALSSFAASEMLSISYPQYRFIFMLIALSRMYLYVHYPTDIIAGIILGILCSKLILMVLQVGDITKIHLLSEIYLR